MKKIVSLLLSFALVVSLFAQTKTTYGKFTKADGSRIKGTATIKGFEDQLIIPNYTGGSDNTGSIEIEVPTAGYIATFRDLLNAAQAKPQLAKITPSTVKPPSGNVIMNAPEKKIQAEMPKPVATTLARAEITVTNRVDNHVPTKTSQIVLENISVESVTDNAATGTSKIKLKASRIGWIYYNTDPRTGTTTTSSQSGWDVAAGKAWNTF